MKKDFKARKIHSTVALHKGALYFQEYTETTNMSLLISIEIPNRATGITEFVLQCAWRQPQVRKAMISTAVKQHAVPYPQRFLPSDCKPSELKMLGLTPHHPRAFSALHFCIKEF